MDTLKHVYIDKIIPTESNEDGKQFAQLYLLENKTNVAKLFANSINGDANPYTYPVDMCGYFGKKSFSEKELAEACEQMKADFEEGFDLYLHDISVKNLDLMTDDGQPCVAVAFYPSDLEKTRIVETFRRASIKEYDVCVNKLRSQISRQKAMGVDLKLLSKEALEKANRILGKASEKKAEEAKKTLPKEEDEAIF